MARKMQVRCPAVLKPVLAGLCLLSLVGCETIEAMKAERDKQAAEKFEIRLQGCVDRYGVDPRDLGALRSYELSASETEWRECAHDAIHDIMASDSLTPKAYARFIETDIRMTERIVRRINTREERRRELRRIMREIRATEELRIREEEQKIRTNQVDLEALQTSLQALRQYEKNMEYIHNAIRAFLAP